ncbi:hypothetical protein DL96DRAFT_1593510 [Flagelloscypha sp. PMI_526]|nr:hypothetical protein DL96DRAFT_1593510 [Flagelloscypha sp. PMI_526]
MLDAQSKGHFSPSSSSPNSKSFIYSSASSTPSYNYSQDRSVSASPSALGDLPLALTGKRRRLDSPPHYLSTQSPRPTSALAILIHELHKSASIASTISRSSSITSQAPIKTEDDDEGALLFKDHDIASPCATNMSLSCIPLRSVESLLAEAARLSPPPYPDAKRTKIVKAPSRNKPFRATMPSNIPASIRRASTLRSEHGDTGLLESPSCPAPVSVLPNGVPIIAPPAIHHAQLPHSRETVAKRWIFRFLERETERRTKLCLTPEPFQKLISKNDWKEHLNISDASRLAIVRWFLEVHPDISFSSPDSRSRHSSLNAYHFAHSDIRFGKEGENLYHQLARSPETRFHAVWLFFECYHLLGSHITPRPSPQSYRSTSFISETDDFDIGFEVEHWDRALACLALSVKYHHDVLPPFLPIWSEELEVLSSHSELLYEELEHLQREILQPLGHQLGSTPQILLDAIWIGLPSLAIILDCDRTPFNDPSDHIEGGAFGRTRDSQWGNRLWKETWSRLFTCLFEPDVLRFRISHLTCVSLVAALRSCLFSKAEMEEKWDDCATTVSHTSQRRSREDGSSVLGLQKVIRERRRSKVERIAVEMSANIQSLCAINDTDFKTCQAWMTLSQGWE